MRLAHLCKSLIGVLLSKHRFCLVESNQLLTAVLAIFIGDGISDTLPFVPRFTTICILCSNRVTHSLLHLITTRSPFAALCVIASNPIVSRIVYESVQFRDEPDFKLNCIISILEFACNLPISAMFL